MKASAFLAAVCILLPAVVRADVLELRAGQIEGKIVEETPDALVLETDAGRITVSRSDVLSIRRAMTPRELYEAALAKIAADDLDGHMALANFCRDKRLQKEMRDQFARVIELDPDNEQARTALGYVQHQGRWISRKELAQSEGRVLFRDRWVTPEERDQTLRQEQAEAYARKFRQLALAIDRGNAGAAEELGRVEDPVAVEPLADLLRYRSQVVRATAVKVLGGIEDAGAVAALVDAAIGDEAEEVRQQAIAILAKRCPREALAQLSERERVCLSRQVTSLDDAHATEQLLERIALAAGGLDDPMAIPLLIRMLEVTLNMINDQGDLHSQAFFRNLRAASELERLTGEQFFDRRQAWWAWWCDHGRDLIGDTIDELVDRLR